MTKYDGGPAETLALELWRRREMTFPPGYRRMKPDAMDYATGAWHRVLAQADAMLSHRNKE